MKPGRVFSFYEIKKKLRLSFDLCELIGNHCELEITRSELSDFISTTTESVIRILSKWNKEKIISTENKKIKILHFKTLQEIWQSPADSDPG